MKKGLVLGFVIMLGCSPSAENIGKVLEENPEILARVIEKHPDKIMAALQNAARTAQEQEGKKAQQEEEGRVARELENPLQPTLSDDRASKGKKSAPITVVEYSDFQCPYCARGFATVQELLKEYGSDIYFVYKHLPLSFHPMAMPAAKRFEAIALQSAEKAYRFHDEVFTNQQRLGQDGEKFLDEAARKAGADIARMKKDMESSQVASRIEADTQEAQKFGISGTPGFIVNGVSIRGAYPVSAFKDIIEKTRHRD